MGGQRATFQDTGTDINGLILKFLGNQFCNQRPRKNMHFSARVYHRESSNMNQYEKEDTHVNHTPTLSPLGVIGLRVWEVRLLRIFKV